MMPHYSGIGMVKKKADCEKLQEDLSKFGEWTTIWPMKFNAGKWMRPGTDIPNFKHMLMGSCQTWDTFVSFQNEATKGKIGWGRGLNPGSEACSVYSLFTAKWMLLLKRNLQRREQIQPMRCCELPLNLSCEGLKISDFPPCTLWPFGLTARRPDSQFGVVVKSGSL